MTSSSSARATGFLFLAVTSVGWALNWAAIKILLREWPPLFSRGVSGVAAAVLLAGVAAAFGESLKVPKRWIMPLLFAAFTNVFAWMGFSTMALKYLAVSEGSLLVYTMPIWAMLFAWPILGNRPSWRDIVALSLGLSGVAVLLSAHGITLGPDKLIGIALALAAAILFALGGVMTTSPLPIPPTALVAWQVGLGCLPMIVFGLLFEHPNLSAITASGWAVLIYMVLGPMGICYLAWFAALRRLPAATAAIGTLSVPIIGVIAASVMLREPLGMREALAIALTLAGVALALQKPKSPMPNGRIRPMRPYSRLVIERDEATSAYTEALVQRGRTQARVDEVQRFINALPRLQTLRSLRAELLPLASLPDAPSTWTDDLPALMIRQTKLATQAQTVAETIGNLRDELERLVVNASTTACLSTKVTAQSPRPRPRGHRSAV